MGPMVWPNVCIATLRRVVGGDELEVDAERDEMVDMLPNCAGTCWYWEMEGKLESKEMIEVTTWTSDVTRQTIEYHVSIMGFLYLAILLFKYDRNFHSRYFDELSTRSGQDGQREPGLNGRRLPSNTNHFKLSSSSTTGLVSAIFMKLKRLQAAKQTEESLKTLGILRMINR